MSASRWPSLTLVILAVSGCALPQPPVIFDVQTRQIQGEVHSCVIAGLVDADFQITESRVADGIVRALRAATERWSFFLAEWDLIEVLIFARNDLSTGLQFTSRTLLGNKGSDKEKAPSDAVQRVARDIADTCG